MTNFEWLKTLSSGDLAKVLTELGLYYEEHVDAKALFAGPTGWQMTREEAEKECQEWLQKEYRESAWKGVLYD